MAKNNAGRSPLPSTEVKRKKSRRRRPVRGKAFQVNKMPKSYLKLLDQLNPYPEWNIEKPRKRKECENMPRPCPFVSCRYHRFVEVDDKKKGSQIKLNFPDVLNYEHFNVNKFEDTCILDLAEEKPRTLEEIGELMNLTRERVRQIEASAIRKLKEKDEKVLLEILSLYEKLHREEQ